MSLKIYHFRFGQSDRVIWLCEELSALIPSFKYEAVVFPRGLDDSEGKKTLLSLHPSGTAPTMVDTLVDPPVTMTESQAIVEYIIHIHGKGHFSIPPDGPGGPQAYAEYMYWTSFANGSFQAFLSANLVIGGLMQKAGFDASGDMGYQNFQARTPNHLNQYNNRLAKSKYLAGEEFTAADLMSIYAFTLFRGFYPMDLTEYKHILRWLKDITDRPAYRKALEVAEQGLPPLIQATVPRIPFEVALGLASWEKMFEKGA